MFGLFKPKLDDNMLASAAVKVESMVNGSLQIGYSVYQTDKSQIDDSLRRIVEAQLVFLAIFRPAFSYAVEDAYFQAGKIAFATPLPAPIKLEQERLGLRQAVSAFDTCKSNLDMRFRYMFVADVATAAEDQFWDEVVTLCQPKVRLAFETKKTINPFWVGAVVQMARGNGSAALEILRDQS